MKNVLLGRSAAELEDWAVAQGHKSFRGRQIHDWLYNKGVKSLSEISALPKQWRTELEAQTFRVGRLKLVHQSVAADATTKLLLATDDGETIETVGIPTDQRLTVCISSQVGCPMACRFCATGKSGLQRSLATHEIVDQVLSVREAMDRRPSHVVFMGMGEPLLNSEAVLETIRCLNTDLGIGQRRITVSTVGVPKTLPQLAELAMEKLGRAQFTLAVSLHAPNQQLREELIPTAHAYPYDDLLDDCRHYLDLTGRRVSFEYILLGE
ncbi:MAG: 23S rRNA (adenine(2503)-C(2))-methyltransferase RlmN, partial [Synechococcus sp. cluster2_bin.209]|nr:23S rRNA (adenine(2503)-C(2))-methyltransferase RlmN [Synechococcus sp. cluster2_bin.209]